MTVSPPRVTQVGDEATLIGIIVQPPYEGEPTWKFPGRLLKKTAPRRASATSLRSPKRGAGGCSVPAPVLGGRLGWGSESAQATKRHSPRPRAPFPLATPRTRRKASKRPNAPTQARPASPKRGAGGCAPAGGTGGVPLFPITLEGRPVGQPRTPSQTPAEAGRTPRQNHRPYRRADAGVRGHCHRPSCKIRTIVL